MIHELKIPDGTLHEICCDKVYRMGKKQKSPRPIVAHLSSARGKTLILQHAKHLDKTKHYGISEQLPSELQSRKQKLMPLFRDARSKQKKTKWMMDKLLVDDKVSSATRDRVKDINVCVGERALEMKVSSTPPKTYAGSTFQGHVVNISCQDDIIPALKALCMDTRVARAEHNMYAYRIGRPGAVIEHFEDDREWGAGKNILTVLKDKDITNKLVVVTRWFDGVHIGPKRFQYIREAAVQVLDK